MAGVYLSYPFCSQNCTYCNFASGVQPRELEHQYLTALIQEIALHQWQWTPDTVYWGGGTPSRIAPEDLLRVHQALPGAPWVEATIEAAPGEITTNAAVAWRAAGINRVSLGVQSFITRELRQTARRHTAETVANDVATLRSAGIGDINIDLIAGLPYQTVDSWRESLAWVARLAPTHVSVYMLEVDEDSRLGLEILGQGTRYGAGAVPSEELTVELYEHAIDELARQGIVQYEISNFARPGRESRHNLKYWRLEPYAGFGSDAHSFDKGMRWQNVEQAAEYTARLGRGESVRVEQVSARPVEERFFVGLRLREGIEPEAADWVRFAPQIDRFVEAGLLERAGTRLRLTRRGVLLSNEVFEEFIEAA